MDHTHFIQPLGIATLVSLLVTVALALIRKRNPRLLFRLHRIQGFVTLGLAIIHFVLVAFSQ